MAILKDTSILGSLRATDTVYGTTGQFTKLNVPTTSDGTTYGPGSNNQVLKSNGSSVYWASDSQGVTSVQVQASSPLQSSTNTAQNASLNTTISFINQGPNKVLAGPSSGTANAAPTFRALVAADLPTSGVTAGSFGPSAAVTGSNNATMNVPYITVDAYGRITAISNKTYTAVNTWRSISDAIDSTSSDVSASSKAVKTAYDLAASKTSLTIGNTATTAAAGNHTHTLSIADGASGDTNQKTLTASTKYKLTAGGSTYVFTTPPNTTYANGTGITIGSGNAINHSNSVTAQTTQALYPIKIDAQGHISAYGSAITPVTGVKGNAESSYRTGQVNLTAANIGAVALSGDTMTGNLIVPSIRAANTYYGLTFDRTTQTPVETILHTGIKWRSGAHMPVIHITGYAYGLESPVEFKIGFYIYGNKIGWAGATNMGSWQPNIYLFKDNHDNEDFVAVGLAGRCYFLQLQADLQDEMGKFNYTDITASKWSWTFSTTTGVIPATDDGTTCISVAYKASILNAGTVTSVQVQATSPVVSSVNTAQSASLNTTISLADGYGDTKNPYASKTKNYVLASGATADSVPSFRALVAADIPNLSASKITSDTLDAARIPTLSITDKTSGTLTVARGGTGVTSFTANSLIMSGSSTTAALTTRAITNNTSNTAITNSNTNIPTMNTIYYGLVGVNNASQSRATTIYAPTGAGTAGQYLKSSGGTSAPVWETFSKSTVGLGNVDNSTYAGGTAVTLNGTSKASSTASFYAPTAAGTAGQFLKSSGGAPTWNDITYPDIKPITSKTYAPAASYGSTDANETCTFFFMSVKPETWYKPWQVRFKIRTVCDSYANVDSITWATLNGRADGFIYHNWNERYDIGHYYTVIRPLKNAGFTAGLGHMVGISVRYATGRGNTAYTRKFYVDYYESENCEVTLLDNANLWANLGNTTSYSDTNYNGYNNMNAVDRGLQETGDSNSTSISHWYEQYGGWVAGNNIKRYQFIFENADHKLVSIYGTDNDYGNVNKTLLTVDFDPLGRIFYYNTTGNNNTDTNIDPGRLYNCSVTDLRYSFNVASTATTGAFTGVRYTQLYLKTAMTASTGMVHVASNQPLVTTLPTSNDGYYYIYLGQVHSWYQIYLPAIHPVYYHNGTTLVRYYGKEIGGNAASATIAAVAASANSVAWSNVSGKPLTLTAQTTGFKISGGTTSKTLTVGADYTLAAACAKGVTDNSSNADVTSSDTNLITGRTLYYQLAKKGYTTNTGTVTSVQVQASSPLQSSTSTAQSTSLNTTISFVNQSANTVLAGPSSGSAAAPAFRSLVAADIPNLNASKINDGTLGIARGGTNISSYAKGDILYASAANTLGKLTIGSSGQVLAVSSSGVPAWTTLPTATSSAVGMVKPGHGLTISSGTLNMSSNFTFDSSNVLTGIAMTNITCDITSSSWTWRDT